MAISVTDNLRNCESVESRVTWYPQILGVAYRKEMGESFLEDI